ncbi:MAG: hypothetical protein ACI9JM_001279 [Halioglobus sp.]|jgi:hypothetical protein
MVVGVRATARRWAILFGVAASLAMPVLAAVEEDRLDCADPIAINASQDRVQCYFAARAPWVPAGMTVASPGGNSSAEPGAGRYPVTFQLPRVSGAAAKSNNSKKLRLELYLHDDSGQGDSVAACESNAVVPAGYLQVRNCAGGYPSRNSYTVNGVVPNGWWGPFGGHINPAAASNADGTRLISSVSEIQKRHPGRVDWWAGFRMRGTGMGGTGAILQSIGLPEDFGRKLLVIVEAQLPHTLFVKDELPHSPEAQLAWGGFKRESLDFEKAAAAGEVSWIYYRINGSTEDDRGRVNLDFFRACDEFRIACFGTWHKGGHQLSEPGIKLPTALFTDDKQDVRLDTILPVFTQSTANNWGKRGHYNLGLSWDAAGIRSGEKLIVVPLRYQQFKNLSQSPVTKPLPDQPEQATFNLTLRRTGAFRKMKGQPLNWSLVGTDQKGTTVVAADGSITVEGITLASAATYTQLWIALPRPTWQLVYTRQPRAKTPVPGSPIKEAANWQHASDVGRINGGLAEADVVIDDLNGKVKVIYNCTTSKEVCVAHEARVSPDGTKIVYSVGWGNNLIPVSVGGYKLGIEEVPGLTHARLFIYDLKTGKNKAIPHHPERAIDRQPEWLNNEKIVFASTRGNTYPIKNQFGFHQGTDQFGRGRCFNTPYCVSQEYGYGLAGRSMQLWTMNIDGTQARNITPHESNALAPAVMSNGDILYSCWNVQENKAFDAAPRNSNNPGTGKNKWWLCRTDGNGADGTVVLNGHKTTTLKTRGWLPSRMTGGEGRSELRAIRSVAEIHKGHLAVSNYYRSNHVGSMGIIYGMDYKDPHIEGCSTARCYPDGESNSNKPGSGRYVPSSLLAITPYGTDQDIDVRRDGKRRPLGKAGYAAPLPNTDKAFMITHGRGSCYEVTPVQQANRNAMRGEPTCQKAIYKVKVPMVTDPFDERQMEMIAGGNSWQAFDSRAIATYQSLHGQPMPDQLPALDPNAACYLEVVDAREGELFPSAEKYSWLNNLYQQCAFQGCAVNTEDPDFYRKNVANLSILLPEMWDVTYSNGNQEEFAKTINNMGYKSIAILGSQPLKADGSVKMQVPCEVPIIMAGTDKNGMSIAHDAMLHSLRKGETRTCHGCHDGHSEERARQLGKGAQERFKHTMAFNTNPPMPKRKAPITFASVQPILEKRCTSCHKDMNNGDGLLYSRIAQDYEQHDWNWARKHPALGQHTTIDHVAIKGGGRRYKVGEQLVFQKPGAKGQVAAVGPRGNITKISLTAGGNGYEAMTAVTVNSAAGKSAHLVAMTSRFDLSRPYTSKWVAKFARDSLLYWKCIGSRQDGRSDRQYGNDIDFGPAHISGATPEECRTIGQWIDTGIQN